MSGAGWAARRLPSTRPRQARHRLPCRGTWRRRVCGHEPGAELLTCAPSAPEAAGSARSSPSASLRPDLGHELLPLPHPRLRAGRRPGLSTSRDVDAQESLTGSGCSTCLGRGRSEAVQGGAGPRADQIAQLPPLAIRSAKRVLQHNTDAGLPESLVYETAGLAYARKRPVEVTSASPAPKLAVSGGRATFTRAS